MESVKVVLVLVDGLKLETAVDEMVWLEAAVRRKQARRLKMRSETPSLSRPLYETIHTGLAPCDHGVMSNETVRLSISEHLFGVIRGHGGTTAASAYSFFLSCTCAHRTIRSNIMRLTTATCLSRSLASITWTKRPTPR